MCLHTPQDVAGVARGRGSFFYLVPSFKILHFPISLLRLQVYIKLPSCLCDLLLWGTQEKKQNDKSSQPYSSHKLIFIMAGIEVASGNVSPVQIVLFPDFLSADLYAVPPDKFFI
jgi:hypothetical protein